MTARYNAKTNTFRELPGMEKPEEWRDIPGYEGFYQVSNVGRIKSIERKIERRRMGATIVPEKILKSDLNFGYSCVRLSKIGKTRNERVHRLVCLAFLPNPENKPQVNHKNGIRHDNRLENLEWCTGSENVTHTYRVLNYKKKGVRGEKNERAKLTEKEIYELAKHVEAGKPIAVFAKSKGMAARTIFGIVNGENWTHIPIDWKSIYRPRRTQTKYTITPR